MGCDTSGPLLKSLDLNGASDVDVAAMGFMMQQPALSPSAALQVMLIPPLEGMVCLSATHELEKSRLLGGACDDLDT